jgi:hypothetical protein
LKLIATILTLLLLALACVALAGCAARPVTKGTPAVASNLGGISATGKSLAEGLAYLKGHVEKAYEALLHQLTVMALEQHAQAVAAEVANDAAQTDQAKAEHQVTQITQKYDDLAARHAHEFFSPRQCRLFYLSSIMAGVGAALCCIGLAGAGGVYTLCAFVGRLLIYGSIVYAPLAWVFDHLWLRKATASAVA